jgi:hypothetical protein
MSLKIHAYISGRGRLPMNKINFKFSKGVATSSERSHIFHTQFLYDEKGILVFSGDDGGNVGGAKSRALIW